MPQVSGLHQLQRAGFTPHGAVQLLQKLLGCPASVQGAVIALGAVWFSRCAARSCITVLQAAAFAVAAEL